MGKTSFQAKSVFVANAYGDPMGANAINGTIFANPSADGCDLILKYKDVKGQQKRSDIIPVENILWVKAQSAEAEREFVKTWTVTLDSNVNSGNIIVGENYLLNFSIAGYYDPSDVNEYIKTVAIHGFAGMTAATFYKKLAISIAKNFSREPDKPIKVFIGSDEITPETKEADISTATSVVIKEAEPYWKRGSFTFARYKIKVGSGTVNVSGDEVQWASIAQAESQTEFFGNGKKTAELEDYSMSMSSDFFIKGKTWALSPEVMVDPEKEYNYLQIHYCHIGSGESPQKSEKDIVVVAQNAIEDDETSIDGKSIINSIVNVINTATGKSYGTLSTSSDGGDTTGGDTDTTNH